MKEKNKKRILKEVEDQLNNGGTLVVLTDESVYLSGKPLDVAGAMCTALDTMRHEFPYGDDIILAMIKTLQEKQKRPKKQKDKKDELDGFIKKLEIINKILGE